MKIPLNKTELTGREVDCIKESISSGVLSGDGKFVKRCSQFLESNFAAKKAFMVGSGTQALEMAFLLADVKSGDEVVVSPFTFPSTINAFVLRGAKPVFVDIRPDTLNIDEQKIAGKITNKTKVIVPMHYAGIPCEMSKIKKIAKANNLLVIEDAAYGIGHKNFDKYLGTIGDMGIYSFHATKSITCGEGGVLLVNNPRYIKRAQIIQEKGTNRQMLLDGKIKQYTWVDVGSSFLMSDLQAAFLYSQLTNFRNVIGKSKEIIEYYHSAFKPLSEIGLAILPGYQKPFHPNFYYLILPSKKIRNNAIAKLTERGISVAFHYLPLHLSKMGKSFGYRAGDFPVTESISDRLLRIPAYCSLTRKEQDYIAEEIYKVLSSV